MTYWVWIHKYTLVVSENIRNNWVSEIKRHYQQELIWGGQVQNRKLFKINDLKKSKYPVYLKNIAALKSVNKWTYISKKVCISVCIREIDVKRKRKCWQAGMKSDTNQISQCVKSR